jgi:hypothetical protein
MYYCLLIAYLSMMNSDARIDNHYIVPLALLDILGVYRVSKVSCVAIQRARKVANGNASAAGGLLQWKHRVAGHSAVWSHRA